MLRALGMTGLAAIFLTVSPKFRGSVWESFAAFVGVLDQYSPFSYAAVAGALVLGFLMFLRGSSAPRRQ